MYIYIYICTIERDIIYIYIHIRYRNMSIRPIRTRNNKAVLHVVLGVARVGAALAAL